MLNGVNLMSSLQIITDPMLEKLAKQSIGMPFHDANDLPIGIVSNAWVADHTLRVEVSIAADCRERITGSEHYTKAIFDMLKSQQYIDIPPSAHIDHPGKHKPI
jgi:hypothetical protein